MNIVVVMGNLTRDPELRYTPKGTPVTTGAIAINRTWVSESGEKKEEVSFIDWTAFGRTGEVISQYLKKGDPIILEGRLKQETWDDKNTHQKRSKVLIIVERMNFVPRRKSDTDDPPRQQQELPARAAAKAPATEPPDPAYTPPPSDDDVPF